MSHTTCCRLCGDALPDDYERQLKHFMARHPENPLVRSIVDDLELKANCRDCGAALDVRSSLIVSHGVVWVSSYCGECEGREPIRPLILQEIALQ